MNFNKAILIGRLTRDPEAKSLPSGQTVVNFGLATGRFFTDKAGQKQQQTEFHNIVLFGKLADIASQYLNKGSLVLIEGRIQTRSWDDPSGIKKYKTEIVGDSLQMGPRSGQSTQPINNSEKSNLPSQEKRENEVKGENIPIIEEKEINVKDIPL